MGLFNRTKKFAAAIALIGALSSACQPNIPKEEARNISRRADEITRLLKKGDIDRTKLREFARIVAKADAKYRIRGIHIPENFVDGITDLGQFYLAMEQWSIDIGRWRSPVPPVYDPARAGNPILTHLFAAEAKLGVRLDEEREQAIHFYEAILVYFNREIKKLRDRDASSIDINILKAKIARVERAIRDLR